MGTERKGAAAALGMEMSQASRADIEALRASDRLQQIFNSGVQPQSATRPAVRATTGISAGHAEALPPARRGGLRSTWARVLVGLAVLGLGIAVVADGPAWVPQGASPVAGAPDTRVAPTAGGPLPIANETPQAGTAASQTERAEAAADAGTPVTVAEQTARRPGGRRARPRGLQVSRLWQRRRVGTAARQPCPTSGRRRPAN